MNFQKILERYLEASGVGLGPPMLGPGRESKPNPDLLLRSLEAGARENRNLLWLLLILICGLFGFVAFLLVRSVVSGWGFLFVLALLAVLVALLGMLWRIWRDQQRVVILWVLVSNLEPSQLSTIVETLYWDLCRGKSHPLSGRGADA